MREDSSASAVQDSSQENELGVVICKSCNEVIYTLPTNGFTKIAGVCGKAECQETSSRSGGRPV
ncbi:GapA-binding peptide SR1P [Cohnella fermenti]|uniref:GapA-binding peptide SR1P n=1 Tax=Cohnella fermenti TaxID=2565925 RepID=A0A4S4CF34_9BACL|nr:GapA-binding peptide SR1P [Cohnella fermenti]THF84625.1 GapA-binding peptide SR1P [Cohnella fermenti]